MKLYATWTVLYTVAKLCPLLPDEGTAVARRSGVMKSLWGQVGPAPQNTRVLCCCCERRQLRSVACAKHHRRHTNDDVIGTNIGSSSSSSNNISSVMMLLTYARNDDDATRANARTSTLTTGTAAGERVAMARCA